MQNCSKLQRHRGDGMHEGAATRLTCCVRPHRRGLPPTGSHLLRGKKIFQTLKIEEKISQDKKNAETFARWKLLQKNLDILLFDSSKVLKSNLNQAWVDFCDTSPKIPVSMCGFKGKLLTTSDFIHVNRPKHYDPFCLASTREINFFILSA